MKYSIVVPVYNAERYLRRCIESIINQRYREWELLLINDGSIDNSQTIIDEYIDKDSRIKSIYQNNAGPGAARNKALDNICGEYVVFVDADDYIDTEYLSLLEKKTINQADIIFIDVIQVDSKGKLLRDESMSRYMELDKDTLLRSMMTGMIPWGGVRKVIKRNLLDTNGIRYSNLKVGEEAAFSFCSLYYAKSIAFLDDKPVYMYAVHNDSQSNIKMDDPWGGTFEVLKGLLQKMQIYEKYADSLNAFNVSSTVVSIDRITQSYKNKERKKRLKSRIQLYIERRDRNFSIDTSCIPLKAKIFIPFLNSKQAWPIVIASSLRTRRQDDI